MCVRMGSANVGTMTGRHGEVVEMVSRRRLNFCCLQETNWKGHGARMFDKYKFFWQGCEEGMAEAGVSFLVEESWIEEILEVKRVSERIMVLRVRVGKSVLNLVSAYAPQRGKKMTEKEEFLISLGEFYRL